MKKAIVITGLLITMSMNPAYAEENAMFTAEDTQVTAVVCDEHLDNVKAEEISENARATTVVWAGSISAQNGIAGVQKILTTQWDETETATIRLSLNNGGSNPIKLSVYIAGNVYGSVTVQPSRTGTITLSESELPTQVINGVVKCGFDVSMVNAYSVEDAEDYTLEEMSGPIAGYLTVNLFRN